MRRAFLHRRAFLCSTLALAALAVCPQTAVAGDAEAEGLELFERRIRPVLVEHCYECHSSKSDPVQGGLRLDTRAAVRSGGDTGPAVAPGNAEGSLLLSAVRYQNFEMPPAGPLPARVIADFQRWIELGAPDPRDAAARDEGLAPQPRSGGSEIDWEAARQYWAFQPPRVSVPPTAGAPGDAAGAIDAFVLARLEAAGLAPNPPAERRTLIRRVTFDLTGLPPTPEEIERFLADTRPDAYRRLVQRLLASPAYAEHVARRWMDVARYAEDQAHVVGNNRSLFYPNAYRYRDWLIDALARDVPYDEFVRLQLAADAIAPEDPEAHVALGFLGLGPKYYRRSSAEVMADEWEDRVDTVGRGLLGLTLACARCHDHKYDPISTEDYYALAGVFASTEMFNRPLSEDVETKEDGQAESPDDAVHILRDGSPTDLHVMIRGDANRQGALVPRRFLTVLSSTPQPLGEGSGRQQLAEAIASASNPLTARVMVNRTWQALFGRGLVATPSNFGALGQRPSHPELLDDLAARWMHAGWSLKWLHHEIVLSDTYRRSSDIVPASQQADPENRLLWRMARRRLSVEQWRDAILASTGRLDRRVGGPSIEPDAVEHGRRTLYSRISRLELNRFLARFDHPDPNAHSGRRSETTTPLQKLFVLNSPFVVQQANFLAASTRAAEASLETRIGQLYARLYGRPPRREEQTLALQFLGAEAGNSEWQAYVHALLAANELLFLD